MKIKTEDLWKHIGEIILVPKDQRYDIEEMDEVNLPKGTYQIVEVHDFGALFYDIAKNVLVDADYLQDTSFTWITTPPMERLELLEDALTKHILGLSAEGWKEIENPTEHSLDLTPLLAKLKTVQIMRKSMEQ